MKVPDEEIVKEVLKGDRQMFALLISRYQLAVYNLMMRYTRNEEDAADLTQDVFLQAFDRLWTYSIRRRFFTWLYTLALNRARDWYRKSVRGRKKLAQYTLHSQIVKSTCNHQQILESDEESILLKKALSRLPQETREILILRYRHECSIREVAEVFNISESAAKMRLKRGIAHLSERLTITEKKVA